MLAVTMHHSRQDYTAFSDRCVFIIRKRITRFDVVVIVFLAITILSCWMHEDIVFRFHYDDSSARHFMLFSFSIFLFIAHRIHLELFRIPSRLRINQKHTNGNAKDYKEFIGAYHRERGTLAFVVVTLPLGLSLVSEVFGIPGVLTDFEELSLSSFYFRVLAAMSAYHFLGSVFFVMLTLQMAILYDTLKKRWRNYVATSITLNLIGFALILLIEPPPVGYYYQPYATIAMVLASLASLYVSFDVIVYSRICRKRALNYNAAAKFASDWIRSAYLNR